MYHKYNSSQNSGSVGVYDACNWKIYFKEQKS